MFTSSSLYSFTFDIFAYILITHFYQKFLFTVVCFHPFFLTLSFLDTAPSVFYGHCFFFTCVCYLQSSDPLCSLISGFSLILFYHTVLLVIIVSNSISSLFVRAGISLQVPVIPLMLYLALWSHRVFLSLTGIFLKLFIWYDINISFPVYLFHLFHLFSFHLRSQVQISLPQNIFFFSVFSFVKMSLNFPVL